MDRIIFVEQRRPYGICSLALDLLMLFLTSGLWIIWIFIREMRKR